MEALLYSNIKEYVKAKLDEIANNDDAQLVAGSQAVEDLDKEIETAVLPSVRKIHLDAPNVLLKGGVTFGQVSLTPLQITGTDLYKMSFAAPSQTSTFMRLVTLKMSDWKRPIQTLVAEDSAEYHKQQNIYLMGTPSRPVGALVHGNGVGTIELYSCSSGSATLSGQYIPEPEKADVTDGGVVVDHSVQIIPTLKYPCLNQITAEVLRSLGRHQEAAVYEQLAVQPFRIDPDWARLNPIASERFNNA